MRQEVFDYINTLSLGTFLLTEESPWSENNVPLYIKNLKKIYVDNTQYTNAPLISTLNGLNINSEEMTSSIYFANDAKTLPANYEDVVLDLKAAKDLTGLEGITSRVSEVTVTYEDDIMITQIDVRLGKLS
jgi:hypothetical protein